MLTARPLTENAMRAAAKKAGVNWTRLMADLKTHSGEIEALLKRNADQAERLGLEGTPGFIIGNVQSFGGMDLKQFRAAVHRSRKEHSGRVLPLSQQPPGI
jgi:protein-disulfide isomerase